MGTEKFPIVNDRDEVILFSNNKEELHKLKCKHRGVHVFIETFGGGFILQKKAKGTENEGKWSSAVSGHVRVGESYTGAAIREMEEELGLRASPIELEYIGKLKACPETGNEFVSLYSYLADEEDESRLKPSEEEIEELLICSRELIKADTIRDSVIYSVPFLLLFYMFLGAATVKENVNE